MTMRKLLIGLAVIFVAWLFTFLSPLPKAASTKGLFIHDKKLNFIWLLPQGWYQAQILTGSDYAFKLRNEELFSLVLDSWEDHRDDANSLTEKHRANPRFLFDAGVKPRFPASSFLRSSIASINTQPAIQTECELVTPLGNQFVKWYCCQLVTIHNNTAYNFVLECPMEKRESAPLLLKKALETFIFLESGKNEFKYVSSLGLKYNIETPAGLVHCKEFLEEVMESVSNQECAFPQHIISAVLNSCIQGLVLPFYEGPKMVFDFLRSPRSWDWGTKGLLEAAVFNFPISPELQSRDAVRTARFVPSVIYAALLLRLIYRKRKKSKAMHMGKEQNGAC